MTCHMCERCCVCALSLKLAEARIMQSIYGFFEHTIENKETYLGTKVTNRSSERTKQKNEMREREIHTHTQNIAVNNAMAGWIIHHVLRLERVINKSATISVAKRVCRLSTFVLYSTHTRTRRIILLSVGTPFGVCALARLRARAWSKCNERNSRVRSTDTLLPSTHTRANSWNFGRARAIELKSVVLFVDAAVRRRRRRLGTPKSALQPYLPCGTEIKFTRLN